MGGSQPQHPWPSVRGLFTWPSPSQCAPSSCCELFHLICMSILRMFLSISQAAKGLGMWVSRQSAGLSFVRSWVLQQALHTLGMMHIPVIPALRWEQEEQGLKFIFDYIRPRLKNNNNRGQADTLPENTNAQAVQTLGIARIPTTLSQACSL